ncbi:MAG: response regulator [Labilithrix sp.]|nr:response regulator [Labilithrix sp.]MCW5817214.1 response regulator [Labilithrix sp.]
MPGEPKPIVSIDDDAAIRRTIARALSEAGYEVHSCPSGAAGIEKLKSVDAGLVLLDVSMPNENGFDVAQKIREGAAGEANRGIPIVFVTAESAEESYERSFDVGAHRYLVKPFEDEQLLATVTGVLHLGG